jgi:hypothetical protein
MYLPRTFPRWHAHLISITVDVAAFVAVNGLFRVRVRDLSVLTVILAPPLYLEDAELGRRHLNRRPAEGLGQPRQGEALQLPNETAMHTGQVRLAQGPALARRWPASSAVQSAWPRAICVTCQSACEDSATKERASWSIEVQWQTLIAPGRVIRGAQARCTRREGLQSRRVGWILIVLGQGQASTGPPLLYWRY